MTWKHKFCHTSSHAIFHLIYELPGFSLFRTPSGLFQKWCGGCGLKMQLPPLHAFVVVVYHLAKFGFRGEDLFGAICCLFTMIYKLDPTQVAELSVSALLNLDSNETCSHREISPRSLVDELFSSIETPDTEELRLGMKVFLEILRHAESAREKLEEADGNVSDVTPPLPVNPIFRTDH